MENNLPVPNNEIVKQTVPVKPTREYKGYECIFAWLCLLSGYLFCRAFPIGSSPLGCLLIVLLLFISAAVVLKLAGIKFKPLPYIAAISAVVLSLALIISGNKLIQFTAYVYALAAYCYFVFASAGNSLEKGFSDFIAADYFKALFVMPFTSVEHIFKAMFSGRAKKGGKFVLKLLLGIAITIIPTAIVLLLLSYDSNFSDLLHSIFDVETKNTGTHILSVIFGIPVGMYIFGLYISSVDHKCKDSMTAESCKKAGTKMKIVPVVTIIAAVLPLIFLYVVFFISQWDYYISGFTGVLPLEFSYAEYAREGFFQLCTVSVINLLVIIAVILFMRRKNERPPVILKIITVIFSVFTLVLISTAMAKLFMYIESYGLTQKRVYAAWLMAVLAVVFVLIAVKQFVPRIKIVAISLAICVVMFAGLSLSNIDGIIAGYNVDRYLDGSLETVDISAMRELGDAAIPEMVRLYETMENAPMSPVKWSVEQFITEAKERLAEEDRGVFAFTIPYQRAKAALSTEE